MKRMSILVLLLCSLLTLAACGDSGESPVMPESTALSSLEQQETTASGEQQNHDASADATLATKFQKTFHMAQCDPFSRGCASEQGYYFVGNRYIYFVEKETLRSTILCGKPECLHQDQDCNAYVGNINHITYYDGKLYYAGVNEKGGIAEGDWNLYSMNADGTQKQKVQALRSPNEGFFAEPMQFIIHNGFVFFKSNRENILCSVLGEGIEAADIAKINDLSLDDEASFASLERWYLWADGEYFYCFGSPEADNYRNVLYTYHPQSRELTQVWQVPSSADVGKWDASDVSVNGWYVDDGILYYFLSGNGIYQYDISRKETKQIAAVTEREQKGTAIFDEDYVYIQNEEIDDLFIYELSGNYVGKYDYSECVSQGVGQETGSGEAMIMGSDAQYVFLCARNVTGMTQDGIGLGYSFYYLSKADIQAGTGSFQRLDLD